jgi:hypothetical protein
MQNPLIPLFQSIADMFIDAVNRSTEKDRAVSIMDIFKFVQESLYAQNPDNVDPEGNGLDMPMPSSYVLDVYVEDAGTFAIITKSDGKLYKVPVTVDSNSQISLGAEQEVVMDFAPVTGRQVTITRQADGKVRWFAMPACTAVLNRDGEIDSTKLFDSFVDHVERTSVYPELDFFHNGVKVLLGKADWVGRDGIAYCASGTFYDSDIARAAIKSLEQNKNYWGLSIAYIPTSEPEVIRSKDGISIPVFTDGINRFISLLPEDTAASILTSISTKEEVNRMNNKMKSALKMLTGDDKQLFDEIALKVDSVNRSADGMISRETETPAAAAETPAPEVVKRALAPEDISAVVASQEFKDAVTTIVTDLMNMDSKDKTPAAETPAPAAAAQENRENKGDEALLAAVASLTAKVEELGKNREAEVQEVLNDLPARISRQTIIRPRATRMPETVNSRTVNMASIAQKTLEKMGESS